MWQVAYPWQPRWRLRSSHCPSSHTVQCSTFPISSFPKIGIFYPAPWSRLAILFYAPAIPSISFCTSILYSHHPYLIFCVITQPETLESRACSPSALQSPARSLVHMTGEVKSAVTQVSSEDASELERPGKPATMTAVLLPGAMEPL